MRIGKCPENAYKRSVKKYLQKETHDTGQDQTITVVRQTALDHEMAPAVFLQDAVNAVCARNAKPVHAAIALALPEDTEEKRVSLIMKQLKQAADSQNVPLKEAAVSTFPGTGMVLQIAVTGILHPAGDTQIQAGDLLLIGPVALAGTAI